jgi:hypothetical protein
MSEEDSKSNADAPRFEPLHEEIGHSVVSPQRADDALREDSSGQANPQDSATDEAATSSRTAARPRFSEPPETRVDSSNEITEEEAPEVAPVRELPNIPPLYLP